MNLFFNKIEPYYKDLEIIETPIIPKNRFTPTSLPETQVYSKAAAETIISSEYSGDNAKDIFAKADKLLDRLTKRSEEDSGQFDSANFGTLSHVCVEALFTGKEAVIPPRLAGSLSPSDAAVFLEAGKELARFFAHSPMGIKAGKAEKRHSEFRFRSLIYDSEGNELFINGTIDLVFEDEDSIWVVDFKTDKEEGPEKYIPQMACYYKAVSDLFANPSQTAGARKECRLWLYYLRSGHAVEVTEQAREYKIF